MNPEIELEKEDLKFARQISNDAKHSTHPDADRFIVFGKTTLDDYNFMGDLGKGTYGAVKRA